MTLDARGIYFRERPFGVAGIGTFTLYPFAEGGLQFDGGLLALRQQSSERLGPGLHFRQAAGLAELLDQLQCLVRRVEFGLLGGRLPVGGADGLQLVKPFVHADHDRHQSLHRGHFRKVGGQHVEFLRGVRNPVGVKVGPETSVEDVVTLCQTLNP